VSDLGWSSRSDDASAVDSCQQLRQGQLTVSSGRRPAVLRGIRTVAGPVAIWTDDVDVGQELHVQGDLASAATAGTGHCSRNRCAGSETGSLWLDAFPSRRV